MGVYDILGETQVKCFYEACFSPMQTFMNPKINANEKFQLWFITGNLRYFNRGSQIPHRTMYYDYGKTFMIFDPSNVEGTEKVHIITEGLYRSSVYWKNLNTFLNPIRMILNKNGDPIYIRTKQDFERIMFTYKECETNYRKAVKNFYKINELSDPVDITRRLENIENEIFNAYKTEWTGDSSVVKDPTLIGAFLNCLYVHANEMDNAMLYRTVQNFIDYCGGDFQITHKIEDYYNWEYSHNYNISRTELINFFKTPTQNALNTIINDVCI